MSVEILMDLNLINGQPPSASADDAAGDQAMPATGNPVQVLISPIVPVAGVDGDAAALPPPYTGVLYLHHHKKEEEAAAAAALGQLNEPRKKREKWLKEMSGWLMVLAVLAASVTYHAGLNPPGGFSWEHNDGEGHVAGTPVLQSNFPQRYTVFFYFNATAFVTSVMIIILLMNESFHHSEAKVVALEIIAVLDMAGLMGAYIAGSTRTAPCSI
uniref:PGG domain-containing protein n=1 Tax=Oryza meridionalis TaxID=40149 RepID=A0A0E0DWY1_9ORYZ